MAKKRAESRTRYFIRNQGEKRNQNVSHISKGGDFVEEQEIINSFPEIGLGLDKPDFVVCFKGEPVMVIEAKNEAKKIDEAINQAIGYTTSVVVSPFINWLNIFFANSKLLVNDFILS